MRRLTERWQPVQVATLSTLRKHLESLSGPDCKFTIEKAHGDRVAVRCERANGGEKSRSVVILPAYPTGHPDDEPANPNVVLDPVEFIGAETCAKREVFAPLLGEEVLAYYHKQHPHSELSISRCC